MTTRKLRFAESGAQTIKEKKAALREYAKKRRADNVNRDVKETLLIENFYKAVFGETDGAGMRRTFFIYLSFSLEAPTDKLIQRLIEYGWRIYCPRVEGKEMVAVEYSEELTLSKFGAREPLGIAYTGRIDLAIVPMLAVDEQGRRLGYGGGYYDRFLAEHGETLRLAYGFDFQILRQVPTQEHDLVMDGIVTDKRILWTGNRREK